MTENLPKIGLVTPACNSESTIAVTIESVLRNDYPHLDYLIVDGKSKDNTLAIARRYVPQVRILSEPDNGQSDALNKGFRLTDGEIIGWLNADDVLYPNALNTIIEKFIQHPEAVAVYGDGHLIDARGNIIGKSDVQPFDRWRLIHSRNYIEQESCFFRRTAFEAAGGVDVRLKYVMDWDLWIKLSRFGDMVYIPQVLSARRLTPSNKTESGGMDRFFEIYRMLSEYGATWRSPVMLNYLYETIVEKSRWGGGLLNSLYRRFSPFLFSSFNERYVYRMKVSSFGSYPGGELPPTAHVLIPPSPGASDLVLQLWSAPIKDVAQYEVVVKINRKMKTRLVLEPGSPLPVEQRWTGCDSSKFNLVEFYSTHRLQKNLDVLGKSVPVAASMNYRWLRSGEAN